jgi:hypothetical protein
MPVAQVFDEVRGEGAICVFVDAECLGDGFGYLVRDTDGSQRTKLHVIANFVEQAGPGLEGQTPPVSAIAPSL